MRLGLPWSSPRYKVGAGTAPARAIMYHKRFREPPGSGGYWAFAASAKASWRFATTCWKSGRRSSGSSGTSTFSASIARRASSRSRRSGASLPNASEASSEHVCTSRSATLALRSSSTSCSAVGSAADSLTGAHLFREDLLHRRTLLVARDLPLGRIPLGDRKPGRGAELLRDRLHPLDELLEPSARRNRLAVLEVDELAGEPFPDRPPEVLLEQAVRPRRQRLAIVECARDPRGQRVDERGERARLRKLRLRVADAGLDGRELQVRPDAPPDLRVLGDRAGLVEEADVLLPVVPTPEPVGDAAAGEHAREHLRARGMEVREHAFDEWRARGQ